MSRSQDILGLIRGIQLVAGASIKTQEAYLKHIWSHSSVRDVVEKCASQTSERGRQVMENPSQELQNVGNLLKETFERSSVVVEGIKQYSASGRSSNPIGDVEVVGASKSFSSIKNIPNLDIASITLKELENLLAEHNKLRNVSLRIDDAPSVTKTRKVEVKVEPVVDPPEVKTEPIVKVDPIIVKPSPPKPKVELHQSIAEDEKQVASVMNFITNYDRPLSPPSSESLQSVAVPEVSYV